jgi:hypothetical protein
VGTPLISYILDDQLKEPVRKALRVTNEDRGIVAGVPGAGKTAYLVLQLIDWMESGQSFVATDIKPEIWAILKYNNILSSLDIKIGFLIQPISMRITTIYFQKYMIQQNLMKFSISLFLIRIQQMPRFLMIMQDGF